MNEKLFFPQKLKFVNEATTKSLWHYSYDDEKIGTDKDLIKYFQENFPDIGVTKILEARIEALRISTLE